MENGGKKAIEKRTKLRERYWPDSGKRIFDPSDRDFTKGYAQVPRVVPLLARLIDAIGGRENAGSLYQTLWCQDWGQGVVEVRNFRSLLFIAGYAGKSSRAERTWTERIAILQKLGLIETASRGIDEHAYILLVDPHLAMLTMKERIASPSQVVFEMWRTEFDAVCEQWGVDLDVYRERLTELTSREESEETA